MSISVSISGADASTEMRPSPANGAGKRRAASWLPTQGVRRKVIAAPWESATPVLDPMT